MKNDLSFPEIALSSFDQLVHRSMRVKSDTPQSITPSRSGVLIALSGGPDSVALLRLALMWATNGDHHIVAAHFNYLLRAEDSGGDETFCRELCNRHAVELHVHRQDPGPLAAEAGRGLEDAARVLRRTFFAQILDDDPRLYCCATGHHQDDQQETLLMRLFRGTGPGGLAGIRPQCGDYIHPLLEFPRKAILDWLAELGQDYRSDSTNLGAGNTRARIRNELLPLARDIFGDRAGENLLRFGALAEQDDALLQKLVSVEHGECIAPDGGLLIDPLLRLPVALSSRLIRTQLRKSTGNLVDLAETHISRLLTWLPASRSGSRSDLVGGWQAVRSFSTLYFKPESAPNPVRDHFTVYSDTATPDEINALDPEGGKIPLPDCVYTLTCPTDNIKGDIRIRRWKQGDRINPFGLEGSRLISDILRENKVMVDDRPHVIIVEDALGPLWIVNLMRAERTRLLPSTASGITITVRGNPDNRS